MEVKCTVDSCKNNNGKGKCKLDEIKIEPMEVTIRWNGLRIKHARCNCMDAKAY